MILTFYSIFFFILSCAGKSNEAFEIKDLDQEILEPSSELANATILNATTNTGKAIQLPIATPKKLSTHIIKRNSLILSNFNYQLDSKKPPNKCNCSITQPKSTNNTCDKYPDEIFSCDSINKTIISTEISVATTNCRRRSTKLLGNKCCPNSNTISPTAAGPISPSISLSKSDTNISESNIDESDRDQMAIYNVASLNNLHKNDTFFNRTLNDYSKNQCLTSSSSYDLCDFGTKSHNVVTLTSPRVLTTVTVSMRNAADVSDKVF